MAIKKKQLEANNLKRRENTLQKNSVQSETVEQRAIAHSKQSLTNTNQFNESKNKLKPRFNVEKNNHTANDHQSITNENNDVHSAIEFHSTENKPSQNSQSQAVSNDVSSVEVSNQSTSKSMLKNSPLTSNHATVSADTSNSNNSANNRNTKLKKNTSHKIRSSNSNVNFSNENDNNNSQSPFEFPTTENTSYENNHSENFNNDIPNNETTNLSTSKSMFKKSPLTSNHAVRSISAKSPKNKTYKFHFNNSNTKFFKSSENNENSFSQKSANTFQKADSLNRNFVKADTDDANKGNFKLKRNKLISSLSPVSAVTTKTTAGAIKKGFKNYKNTLEQNDAGVQVTGQSLTAANKTFKITKQTFKAIQNAKKQKIAQNKKLNRLNDIKRDIKDTEAKIKKLKLTKRHRELGQAYKELKIKKTQLKSLNSNLKQKKPEANRNFIKNSTVIPLSSAITKGAASYQKELERDDTGVEITSKGATLAKQSVVSLNKARTQIRNGKKASTAAKQKLSVQSSKLNKKQSNVNKATPINSKLQKKAIKKKLVSKNGRKRLLGRASGVIGTANTAIVNFVKNFSVVAIKKAILGKVAMAASGGLSVFVPILLVLGLVILIVSIFGMGAQHQRQIQGTIGLAQNLSPEVEQWRDLVTAEATAQGMENYIDLILAIIQVESGGTGTPDIMQSSESAGYPRNYFQTELESVRQGISYLKSIVTILEGYNMGYENNARLIAQSYNFGSPFANYVGNRGGSYDLTFAEEYSRAIVAPSLGNLTGETYSYVNSVSQSFGKTYLYRDGGNFFYGELVGQYLGRPANIQGDFATVLAEIENYNGWEYVWGGKSPSVGFDCSGLVAWGLKQVGIDLPSPASNQYHMTVPIDASEALPGDLIFFRGTYGGANHISHVGFYIDENTMYDANGSGVGYHNWKSDYWQSHKPEIRRIVQ